MAKKVHLLVGTKKGAFILEGGAKRDKWKLRGPFCEAWPINHVAADAAGTIYAGGGNEWFGPAVWKSADLGKTWTHSSQGLAYKEGETPIKSVWSLSTGNGVLYAGVEPAGLFRSTDGGESWSHVEGLRNHPSRAHWQPGGGGLILHHILRHPEDENRIWAAISAAGLFYSADGGRTWEARNKGVRCDFLPEENRYPEFGQCIHSIAMAPGMADRIYQQNHCGMYLSEDGGREWKSIEPGLPSTFGFPTAVHPRDPDTLYLLPLNGDILGRYVPEAKAAVWKTTDAGKSWKAMRKGLPQKNVYFGVLRQAMATDPLSPAGVYFGTSSGSLYASPDEGRSWDCIAEHMPTITSIETMVS
ncbi:MAG: sialidase family protein [Pseudomonadota bacterium]|nr:sialidase family protein [Pseudomonadota bacterium]